LRLIATQILEQNWTRKRCVSSPEMDMKNTAAKLVSAIFATVLAGSPLFAAPETEEKAEKEKPADTCLLGPSASVPSGGHWYYRYDRVNKRNCWYLGDAKGKSARKPVAEKQVAEEDAADPEKPAAPAPKKPAVQRSVTDARAEFQPPQTSVEPASKAAAPPWPAVAPVDAQRTEEPRKVVTTRWPESAAASPPVAAPPAPTAQTQPQVAQTQPQAAQIQPQVAQPQTQPQTQAAPVAPPPPRPAVPPAAPAKATAAADQPLSLPMLLTVLVGGLSVIGVLVSAMFGRGKRGSKSRPGYRLSRSAPMPPLEQAEQPRPQKPLPEQPQPEEARAPEDPTRRLQQMLAEIQKRAAA
jgi:hypothetical protein